MPVSGVKVGVIGKRRANPDYLAELAEAEGATVLRNGRRAIRRALTGRMRGRPAESWDR